MKTAVIGLGNIGSRVAANLVAGGESVIVSDPDEAKERELVQKLEGRAEALPVEEALAKADVIVLAVWFHVMKDFVAKYRNALVGKIVVDPSNPLAPNGKGGFDKIIPADQSSGEIIAGLLPPGAELVKAFGTLTAESLSSGANRKPERAVLAPMSAGGIDQSIRIEAFGDLHQVGKLGKLVSVKEAQAAV
jgi:8-hydroxy-5-deazaflavin:NADPH oxidoreductase